MRGDGNVVVASAPTAAKLEFIGEEEGITISLSEPDFVLV
jgi:hypothetical protein